MVYWSTDKILWELFFENFSLKVITSTNGSKKALAMKCQASHDGGLQTREPYIIIYIVVVVGGGQAVRTLFLVFHSKFMVVDIKRTVVGNNIWTYHW